MTEARRLRGSRPEVAIAFGMALAALIAGGAAGYRIVRRLAESRKTVMRTHEVVFELESLLSSVKDAETSQRGYLLTEDEAYMGPYGSALKGIHERIVRLEAAVSTDRRQQIRLAALERRIDGKLGELARTIDLARRGERPAALRIVHGDSGRILMDQIRDAVGTMQRAEESLLPEREAAADESDRELVSSIVLTVSLGALFVAVAFFLVQRDVRLRFEDREREKRLLKEAVIANAKFRAFFEQGAIFAGIMHVDGTILEPNRLSWEGCGFTRDQIVGRPFWEGPWWTPSPELVERIRTASLLAAGGEAFRAEMPYFVADGSERMVDISILPIRDEEGRVAFLAPTGADITLRKKLEDDLRRFAKELSEADRRKDEFLATLSHEIRNPVGAISNAVEVLNRLGPSDPTLRGARDVITRQIAYLTRLVDDLLDVSRITHGKVTLSLRHAALAPIVEGALNALRPSLAARRQELRVDVTADPLYVKADEVRVAQIVTNLVTNASRYSPVGSPIDVRLRRQPDEAVLDVTDAGQGISSDVLPRIFDLFVQGRQPSDGGHEGLGIGLNLAMRLAEKHGGRLEVRSEGEGRGSTFSLHLPLAPERMKEVEEVEEAGASVRAPAVATPASAPPGGARPARRILIVDDHEDSVEILEALFSMNGHQVRAAHDGASALSAAAAFDPEVVILDIALPDMDGYEVARRLRSRPGMSAPFLVALTGHGHDEDRRRAAEAGFDAHRVKPVPLEELLELVTSPAGARGEP